MMARRGAWSGWKGLSAADASAGGGACKNSVTRAGPEIGGYGRV